MSTWNSKINACVLCICSFFSGNLSRAFNTALAVLKGFVCPSCSICLSVCLSVRPSVRPSIHPSYLSVCLSSCLPASLSLSLPTCLPYLYLCLPTCLLSTYYLSYKAPSHLSQPLQQLPSDVLTPLHTTPLYPCYPLHIAAFQYYSWQSFLAIRSVCPCQHKCLLQLLIITTKYFTPKVALILCL